MALDDIYRVTVHYELPTSAASYSLYYKETTASDGVDLDTEKLGDAFDLVMAPLILGMLSDDCSQPSIATEKVFGVPAPIHWNEHGTQVGDELGPSLPNNCNLTIGINQNTFTQRSNGRIRVPGIPELETGAGTISSVYRTGPLELFVIGLAALIAELSGGSGIWSLGVISAKVRDVALPAKDWAGAFAPATSIVGKTIIGILRSRSTRARGRAIV